MTTNTARKRKPTSLLSGIREVAADYDFFILDLWGVVHNGIRPFDGVTDCLIQLKRRGKRICLLSNSPSRTVHSAEMLAAMGIGREMYDHLLTSGEAVNMLFRSEGGIFEGFRNARYYDLWPESYGTTMDSLGLLQAGRMEDAGFVIGAFLDTDNRNYLHMYEDELKKAFDLGLPMICANPDRKAQQGSAVHLCPGTLAKRYEEMGGMVYWVGKPYPLVYKNMYDMTGRPDKKRMIAVGDSIGTDIHGACDFGIDSILNLTGLHSDEVFGQNNYPEEARIKNLIDSHPHKPSYTMAGFRW